MNYSLGNLISNGRALSKPIRSAAFIGSSSVEQNYSIVSSNTVLAASNAGFAVWTCAILRQRMMMAYNAAKNTYEFGLSGANTDTMRTNPILGPAAISAQPDVAFIYAGMTECASNTATTTAVALARIQGLYGDLVAGGIKKIVIMATGPRNAAAANGTGYYARQQALVTALASWTSTNNILFCNLNSSIQDGVTGDWLTGMSSDGVHPNIYGSIIMGQALATWCLANLKLGAEPLNTTRINSLVGSNPKNIGGTTLANDYTRFPTSTSTVSLENATDGGARWQVATISNPSSTTWTNNTLDITGATKTLASQGLSTGQLLRGWSEVQISGGIQRMIIQGSTSGTSTPRHSGILRGGGNITSGPQWTSFSGPLVFVGPVVAIPSDATTISNSIAVDMNMTNIPGTFKFRYLGWESVASKATPAIGS